MEETSNQIVSVVLTSCGAQNYLWDCLDSLKAQAFRDFELILIDNSADQGLAFRAEREFPGIKVHSPAGGYSFCQSLNLGINKSRGEFILCLNDDVVLDKNFIAEALKGFSKEDTIGMVSGKILRRDGKTIDSAGLFLSFWRTAKERGYGKKDIGSFEKEECVFGVNGAAAFYRKSMLDQVIINREYFDPEFGFFYEDLDLSWRAQRLGWKAYYLPQAIAYHSRGGTLRSGKGAGKPHARNYLNDDLLCDLVKNRYLAIIRNESCLGFLLHLPGNLLYDLFVWGYLLIFRPQVIRKIILKRQCLLFAFKLRLEE